MEKHCESEKRFGKELEAKAASMEKLEEFIRDCRETTFHQAYRLAGNMDEAHELVQEGLYRVMLAWNRYDTSRPLGGWFYSIMRNAFRNSRRSLRRRRVVSLGALAMRTEEETYEDGLPGKEGEVLALLERKEKARAVRRALSSLDQHHRAVLSLCDMEGLRYDEIARSLKVPIGTVRSRLYRARRAFRASWQDSASLACEMAPTYGDKKRIGHEDGTYVGLEENRLTRGSEGGLEKVTWEDFLTFARRYGMGNLKRGEPNA